MNEQHFDMGKISCDININYYNGDICAHNPISENIYLNLYSIMDEVYGEEISAIIHEAIIKYM
jgi:hypothetical protein